MYTLFAVVREYAHVHGMKYPQSSAEVAVNSEDSVEHKDMTSKPMDDIPKARHGKAKTLVPHLELPDDWSENAQIVSSHRNQDCTHLEQEDSLENAQIASSHYDQDRAHIESTQDSHHDKICHRYVL